MSSNDGSVVLVDDASLLGGWSTSPDSQAWPIPGRPEGIADWRIRRTLELLDSGLPDHVGLHHLAGELGLSIGHLRRIFRAATGDSPHQWLMRRRMERARRLLADPRLSVTDVALACGFSSSQHFASAFRQRIGMTPTGYRKLPSPVAQGLLTASWEGRSWR